MLTAEERAKSNPNSPDYIFNKAWGALTREEKEAATKERAQLERRQRNADRALALFLAPVKAGGSGGGGRRRRGVPGSLAGAPPW